MKYILTAVLVVLGLTSCNETTEKEDKKETVSNPEPTVIDRNKIADDAHSFSNPDEVGTSHIHLDLKVDFYRKVLKGMARLELVHRNNKGRFVLDSKGLKIEKVYLNGDSLAAFEEIDSDPLLGEAIEISIDDHTKFVDVYYETSPDAEALQWLNAAQTAGGRHPYLFTQGQAILTRSWVPCQDTPAQRITYSATVKCPKNLMVVMSATNPTEKNNEGVYNFEMNQSIPSYLLAMAVGDLVFHKIGPRTGVYTEPSMLDASAKEFEDMEEMMVAAEGLYGAYLWDRYDVIVLPPSFPFGGMENPRLTFATPTIIAGDKSLVSLIAHELAHSWSGNLVTNATWDDFWLNEGFTVYFENRIMEEVYGKDYSDMLMMLGEQELRSEIAAMYEEGNKKDTYLKLRLANRNPDDGMTSIAYDKGAFFLKRIETAVGREKFDAFLKNYFTQNQFNTITTEQFIVYLDEQLLSTGDYDINIDEWIYSEGLPKSHVQIMSDKFKEVDEIRRNYYAGIISADEAAKRSEDWAYQQTLHFLRGLDSTTTIDQMKALDEAFQFTQSGNSEILSEWFVKSIRFGYTEPNDRLEDFLLRVGRRKFLKPIYNELAETEEGKNFALKVYRKARRNYHSVSTGTIDKILGWNS